MKKKEYPSVPFLEFKSLSDFLKGLSTKISTVELREDLELFIVEHKN